MKKLFLLSLGIGIAMNCSLAQTANVFYPYAQKPTTVTTVAGINWNNSTGTAAKTTGTIDTIEVTNDTGILNDLHAYVVDPNGSLDSGFAFGPNALGAYSFAERYDIGAPQPGVSISVIGMISIWTGEVNPSTLHTFTGTLWSVDSTVIPDNINNNRHISALPGIELNTEPFFFSQLSIDTPTITLFGAPPHNVPASGLSSFYIGFTTAFSFYAPPGYPTLGADGDTVGLYTSSLGSGHNTGEYNIVNNDTVFYARSVTEMDNFNIEFDWLDNYWDLGANVNYAIFPIVVITDTNATAGIQGVTKNDLTVFSCYPNPAVTNTNLRFSLNNTADMTVQVMDAAGHIINTIRQPQLNSGIHTINISTADMAAGNYICMLRTSAGDALAIQLTVVK
jgi:hypothetical protein